MKIGIPKEIRPGETRVAASSDAVKKLIAMGAEVVVETGAGAGASLADDVFTDVGATIGPDAAAVYGAADLVLKVQRPMTAAEGGVDEAAMMKSGATLVGLLAPLFNQEQVNDYASRGITAFSMELIPRISRAQSMDALSSQSNIAGYKAVVEAANAFGRIFPMMMTAAGTVPPARAVVMGAGVAGLQAIATARRLGAVVSAFDVRPAVKEQVENLGAKFIEVDAADDQNAETAAGYAREMGEDYQRRQAEVLRDTLKTQDICITTAQIPGRPAPILVTEEMVKGMKPGSVIVDLAVETGGNCALSERDQVVVREGVTIIGHTNWPALVPTDTSTLYARNLVNFVDLMIDKEAKTMSVDWDDEIIQGALLTRDGAVVNPAFAAKEL
ncbi:MAG: Re/Si-specific NAD(P)(+) transhydrogenase subunit alpha [Alphaproteobacteria bacterium]|nr:Re/Si-specific NAD(P)(+) transhydrogenase subunit alpha [Alphaproteobacteria bacterium]